MPFLVAVLIVIPVLQKRERNHIKFLQMLIWNRREKIKRKLKKKIKFTKAGQTPLATQQLDSFQQCQKKTPIFAHARTTQEPPLLPPVSPAQWFPKWEPTLCIPSTTGLWDDTQASLIFTPTERHHLKLLFKGKHIPDFPKRQQATKQFPGGYK